MAFKRPSSVQTATEWDSSAGINNNIDLGFRGHVSRQAAKQQIDALKLRSNEKNCSSFGNL